MKEGVFVINYFAHCVDVEEVYKNMISPVYEKYKLTYMEFTVLMFLANNPQYNTATQIAPIATDTIDTFVNPSAVTNAFIPNVSCTNNVPSAYMFK